MKQIFNFTTDKEKIKNLINDIRYDRYNRVIVYTNGCFDVLHPGHVYLLNESAKLGDILIVGVNSDKSVKLLKGEGRPILNEEDRSYMLSSLNAVDYVIIFDEINTVHLIEFLEPDIITKASEYKIKDLDEVGGKFMKENGKKVILIPYKQGLSTSNLIKKLN